MYYIFASTKSISEQDIFAAITAAHKLNVELYTKQAIITQEVTLDDSYIKRMLTVVPQQENVKVGVYFLSIVYFHEDRFAIRLPEVTLVIADNNLNRYINVPDQLIQDLSECKFSIAEDTIVSMDEIRFAIRSTDVVDRIGVLTREMMSLDRNLKLDNYVLFSMGYGDADEQIGTLCFCNDESTFINILNDKPVFADMVNSFKEQHVKIARNSFRLVSHIVEKPIEPTYRLTALGAELVGAKEGDTLTHRSDLFDLCDQYEMCFSVDSEFVDKEFDAKNIQHYVALKPEHWED